MSEDWPRELFIEKAELYQLELEERLARAEEEAELLIKLFRAHGVPSGGKILDLCCGIGRHSVALAKRGYFVVGVDFSPKFLERAAKLAEEADVQERVEFVLHDVRELQKFPKKDFDAVISLFTSFGYYSEDEDRKLLVSTRKLVKPGGIFVLDVHNRDHLVREFRPHNVAKLPRYMVVEEGEFDLEKSRLHSRWLFFLRPPSPRPSPPERGRGEEKEEWVYAGKAKVSLREYSLHELIRMFTEAGWRYCTAYGGLDMSPCGLRARRLVVVAQNPG